MNHEIKRATGLLVLEAVNSNPNGDPDRDGEPRQRDNGRGEISPVSFKRKLRDLIEQNDKDEHDTPLFKALPEKFSGKEHEKQYLILEHRGRNRSQIKEEMRENSLQSGRRKFVERYWDARVFGNTFLEEGEDNFIRTGVVQFGMGISLAPVEIIRQTNTNKAGVESGKDRGMDAILEYLGIPLEQSMAFGDGENDLSMLRHAGIGVAMGTASQEVRQGADYVTGTVDEDGIVTALKHFGLL